MMKFIFSFLFLASTFNAYTCEVSLPSHILKLKNNLNVSDLDRNHHCDEKSLDQLFDKLSNIEGKVLTQTLSEGELTISPRFIQVSKLEDVLNKNLLSSDSTRFFNAKTLMNKSFISLSESSSFNCLNCDSVGDKQIKLTDANGKLIIIKATLKRKASFYVATRDISPYDSELSYKDFLVKTDYIESNINPFPLDERVEFFKSLRFIKRGQTIENNMLLGKNLVRMGSKVLVLFKSEDVSIKASALAKRSGKYGDYIELVNPNSNKKITAKIIDFNKAIVDL